MQTKIPESLTSDISTLLQTFRKKKEGVFLFISGGSVLNILDSLDTSFFDDKITVAMIDERFSDDPEINNFEQLKKTAFYKRAKEQGTEFVDTTVKKGEVLEEFTLRYEKALRKSITKDTVIIAIAGIGPDAHTAGIMPYPENPIYFNKTFVETEKWVVGYNAGVKSKYNLRATATVPLLRKINYPFIYATGEQKREALNKLFASEGKLNESPCRIWREFENAVIFTEVSHP